MSAARYDIVADQGEPFDRTWKCEDTTGAPVDLTGASAELIVRDHYGAEDEVLHLDTESGGIILGGTAGTIRLTVSEEDMAGIVAPDAPGLPPVRVCVHNFKLRISGTSIAMLEGKFTMKRGL